MNETTIQRRVLIFLLGATFLLFIFLVRPFLSSLLLAAALAIISQPLCNSVKKIAGGRAGLSAMVTIVFLALIVLVPIGLLGAYIATQALNVYSDVAGDGRGVALLEGIATQIEDRARVFAPDFSIDIHAYTGQIASWMFGHVGMIFSNVAQFFLVLSLALLGLYYFLKDGKKFVDAVVSYSPLSDKYDREIIARLEIAVKSVLRGSLIIAFIQGILTGVGFMIFGVPNGALWGSIAAISALVPTVGTSLVLFPGIAYLILQQNFIGAAGLFVWGMLAVGLIDNFLGPRLIERKVAIHPFLILLSVLGGISFFGLIGYLLGPLVLSFLFAILKVYQVEFAQKAKE
ncbi:MAG: hypothetical protein A2748_01830 [Candidatus Wildermuthbacteria bacterium RIFCSPHIGHO2_01_FULL_45_20]|uniref:AI-2E family transporter n=1 Tax=Candidatus Wildermuthbacteria bacterium RIFCSPHIGHO2_02_FULL_45_25 TaxID=1802450 RepID=A0A1G2R1J9_9BACT|nr:MAG: hypothetical protein A2748_01830 [Candidatus Wildermuthbacteria bacterium RIFCSPHIGHO2_01_FULL_45_20]OHA66755.1 MAG: hypothetical protein A3C04_03210 [Candidatus Wildermuthbacteria bacterium RIFCSPHIGHO2_02_FULL_45_25]